MLAFENHPAFGVGSAAGVTVRRKWFRRTFPILEWIAPNSEKVFEVANRSWWEREDFPWKFFVAKCSPFPSFSLFPYYIMVHLRTNVLPTQKWGNHERTLFRDFQGLNVFAKSFLMRYLTKYRRNLRQSQPE